MVFKNGESVALMLFVMSNLAVLLHCEGKQNCRENMVPEGMFLPHAQMTLLKTSMKETNEQLLR